MEGLRFGPPLTCPVVSLCLLFQNMTISRFKWKTNIQCGHKLVNLSQRKVQVVKGFIFESGGRAVWFGLTFGGMRRSPLSVHWSPHTNLRREVSAVTVSFIHHVSFLYLNMSASAIPMSSKLREELRFIFLSVVMER